MQKTDKPMSILHYFLIRLPQATCARYNPREIFSFFIFAYSFPLISNNTPRHQSEFSGKPEAGYRFHMPSAFRPVRPVVH